MYYGPVALNCKIKFLYLVSCKIRIEYSGIDTIKFKIPFGYAARVLDQL